MPNPKSEQEGSPLGKGVTEDIAKSDKSALLGKAAAKEDGQIRVSHERGRHRRMRKAPQLRNYFAKHYSIINIGDHKI